MFSNEPEYFLSSITSILTELSFFGYFLSTTAQATEWSAMFYVMDTQKDRKIEEILYDYNTENINESI
jgi:hypothetical protein